VDLQFFADSPYLTEVANSSDNLTDGINFPLSGLQKVLDSNSIAP
jgi:hypothetical protein